MTKDFIVQMLPDQSKYITGFADMTGLLHEKYAGYRYAISLARRLDDNIMDAVREGPNRAYFEHYHEVNNELFETIHKISAGLTKEGYENIPVTPTVSEDIITGDFYTTLRMAFSHKMAATRAGIGWIGKTDLLVTKEYGPRVRLASVLLKDKLFTAGIPYEKSLCGNCGICVKACPAQAATGGLWDTMTDRDRFYDAFKCMNKCRELSLNRLNENASLCGICVSLCPMGK